MTFIKLTNDNFTKTKIINNIKRFYKNSDASTYEYDNSINSKNILPVDFENLNSENLNNIEIEKINNFFLNLNKENIIFENFLDNKNTINNIENINNKIKLNNLKNIYKIDRLNSRFLYDDDFIYKKNTIKNNLYESYYRNSSFDLFKNIEYGFCNYNSVNLYSNNDNHTHSNCIVYANELNNNKNVYDLYNKDKINISFRVIFRKIQNLNKINNLIHIPDLIDVYFIKSNLNDSIRMGISLGNKTKLIKNDLNINFDIDSRQVKSSQSQYLTPESFLELNKWYYINLSLVKNGDTYLISINKDLEKYDSFELVHNKENENNFDSYICLGNKPKYFNFEKQNYIDDYKSAFDILFSKFRSENDFGSLYNKDITTTTNISNNSTVFSILEDFEYITFDHSDNYTCAFNGEFADIRIYNSELNFIDLEKNYSNYITNLASEKLKGLIFYLPVFFIPAIKKELSNFNLAIRKYNIKHSGYYNSFIANGCGLFQLNVENYLIEFCNVIKPNVIFGGIDTENIYINNLENNVYRFFNIDDDNQYIKKGYSLQEIFLKNYINSSTNDVSCLSYNNLLILPNDNGIPVVNWETISEVINSNKLQLETDYEKYFRNKNEINLYNISCNDIINDIDLYKIDNKLLKTNIFEKINIKTDTDNINKYITGKDNNLEYSNILYHDNYFNINNTDIVSNIRNSLFSQSEKVTLNKIYNNIKNHYKYTESNPVIRNITKDDLTLGEIIEIQTINNKKITYRKLPLPYVDLLKETDNQFITIFNISNKLFNKKIKKNTFKLSDNNFVTSNNKVSINLKDNNGILYRSDCLTKVADWNYVGHIFYSEGVVQINNPISVYFGFNDFESEFLYETSLYVNQIDIPVDRNLFNKSSNKSYDETLRHDASMLNSDESFVYITDIHLHDENYNIIAKAKAARPIPKKQSDRFLIKLKMDY